MKKNCKKIAKKFGSFKKNTYLCTVKLKRQAPVAELVDAYV